MHQSQQELIQNKLQQDKQLQPNSQQQNKQESPQSEQQARDLEVRKAQFAIQHNEWLRHPHTALVLKLLEKDREVILRQIENLVGTSTVTENLMVFHISVTRTIRNTIEIIKNNEKLFEKS